MGRPEDDEVVVRRLHAAHDLTKQIAGTYPHSTAHVSVRPSEAASREGSRDENPGEAGTSTAVSSGQPPYLQRKSHCNCRKWGHLCHEAPPSPSSPNSKTPRNAAAIVTYRRRAVVSSASAAARTAPAASTGDVICGVC